MTETTARTRQPFDVRLTDRGADIWSGPTDNDVIFGTVYDKGPGSYDHEEMAKVWAAAYPVMFPALARIRDRARNGGKHALLDLAWIAEEAAAALPGPTIGDLNGATPADLSASPAPAVPAVPNGWKLVPVEPTDAMMNAGEEAYRNEYFAYEGAIPHDVVCHSVLRAMVAAAPPAPSASPSTQAVQGEALTEALLALEGIINWCDLALAHRDKFDSHGVQNLTGPAFDIAREVLATHAAALAAARTKEG